MKILITGASGFIGSHIVEEALRRGLDTWAGVRKTSSRRYLNDERIHFLDLDFSSKEAMTESLRGKQFDYIVHAAGVTKCLNEEDFERVNTQGTINLVSALLDLAMPIERFVYLSSLSIFGAIHERQPHADIDESDTPRPNTAYGRSKLKAEQFLDSIGNDFPYIVLRPTGVYGPRETDYLLMARSIRRHVDFAAGFSRQDITFVYVKDLVQAIFLAFDHGMDGRKYFITDGEVYSSRQFSDLLRRELGSPWCLRLCAPLWLLKVVTSVADKWAHATGKPTTLNNDKYHILRQRNWKCDIEPAVDELGYRPQYKLDQGVRLTVDWYKKNDWL